MLSHHLRNNVVGYVALFLALTAGAYAAGLPKNSVKSKQIKNGQVRAADIGPGAVDGSKVADDTLTGADVLEASLDRAVVQTRVSGGCDAGSSIRSIAADGSVACETPDLPDPILDNSESPDAQQTSASLYVDGTIRTSGQLRVGSEAGAYAAPPAYPEGSAGVVVRPVRGVPTGSDDLQHLAEIAPGDSPDGEPGPARIYSESGTLVVANRSPANSLALSCVLAAAGTSGTPATSTGVLGPYAYFGVAGSNTAVRADCLLGDPAGGQQTHIVVQRASTAPSSPWQGSITSTRNQ